MWLQRLVDGMQGTMKAIIKRAYRNVQEMSFEDFVFSHPAQVGLPPLQKFWVRVMVVPHPHPRCYPHTKPTSDLILTLAQTLTLTLTLNPELGRHQKCAWWQQTPMMIGRAYYLTGDLHCCLFSSDLSAGGAAGRTIPVDCRHPGASSEHNKP